MSVRWKLKKHVTCLQDRIELKRGDSIEVAVSPYPLPTICRASAACFLTPMQAPNFGFLDGTRGDGALGFSSPLRPRSRETGSDPSMKHFNGTGAWSKRARSKSLPAA